MGNPFSSSHPAEDRRWESHSPFRPLLGLLATSVLLGVVHSSSWLALTVHYAGAGPDSVHYGLDSTVYCSCPGRVTRGTAC